MTRGSAAVYAKTGVENRVQEDVSEITGLMGNYTINKFERKYFCVVYRPDAVHFIKLNHLMESLDVFMPPQKKDHIVVGLFNANTLIEKTHKKKPLPLNLCFTAIKNINPNQNE